MKQKTYCAKTPEELSEALSELAASDEYRESSDVLVHIMAYGLNEDKAAEALSTVRAVLPRAQTIGALYTGAEYEKRKDVEISASFFERSHLEMREYGPDEDLTALGETLSNELSARPDVKGVEVIFGGNIASLEDFFEAATAGHDDIPFFGAALRFKDFEQYEDRVCDAASVSTPFWKMPHFICGKTVQTFGLILMIYSGDDLHIKADSIFGWKPLGREMTLTKTEDNCVAVEINGMPATEIYHKYLKVLPDEYFLFNIVEFPFVIDRDGFSMPRSPVMYDDEKKLYFTGHIYEGDRLRLSYGNASDVLYTTWLASEEMRAFGPEYVVLVPCKSRAMFLKENAQYEVKMYERFLPETMAFPWGMEILRYHGHGGVLNNMLVAIGIREGEAKPYPETDCPVQAVARQAHVVPLSDRLAAFVDVAAQELEEETRKAQAANLAKSQFLSNMSHEIRTPINAITGMNEMILREAINPAVREYAENVRSASSSLLGLVNDILDFSKIEAGKLEIIPVEYEISSVLNDLVNMVKTRAEKKGLEFSIEASPELPTLLFGDEIRLKQIVTNILTNAVKYTEKGGVTLRISFEKADRQNILLRFSIQDTGIGIKPEDIEKLFNAFERIEETRNRTIEGTGLGLNITKRLLELMGSRLEVESVYGQGSIFSFTVEQRVVNWSPIGNFEEAYRRTAIRQQVYRESFTAPQAHVLVVDDTTMNLTVMRGLLKATKVQIDEAESGQEALALTMKKEYDVIFLDHRMPGMDGVETLAALRAQSGGKNERTPVICLTANAISGAREWYLAQGFNDYLTKPIIGEQLEAMLVKYLPPERVTLTGDHASKDGIDGALPEWMYQSNALDCILDVKTGLQYCGSADDYLAVLRVFRESAAKNAGEIEKYLEAKDWKNFTTKVHALKSSARIIGASELSERAARLEDAGNRAITEEIEKDTPALLALYRACEEALSPLNNSEQDAGLPEIDTASLHEAYAAIREMAATFDYTSIQFVLAELEKSRVPKEAAERHSRIVKAAKNLDWDELKMALEE